MERAVAETNQEDIQRWTTKRKAALVLSILKGDISMQDAARCAASPWQNWRTGRRASFWPQRTRFVLVPKTRRRYAKSKSKS